EFFAKFITGKFKEVRQSIGLIESRELLNLQEKVGVERCGNPTLREATRSASRPRSKNNSRLLMMNSEFVGGHLICFNEFLKLLTKSRQAKQPRPYELGCWLVVVSAVA